MPSFAFSVLADFLVLLASWSGADASHTSALNTSSTHLLRGFRTFHRSCVHTHKYRFFYLSGQLFPQKIKQSIHLFIRSHSNPEILPDLLVIPMTYINIGIPELPEKPSSVIPGMAREQEVRLRIRKLKSKLCKFFFRPLSRFPLSCVRSSQNKRGSSTAADPQTMAARLMV